MNTNSKKRVTHFKAGILLMSAFLAAGCATIPGTDNKALRVGSDRSNVDLFETQEQLEDRAAMLKAGMTTNEVFETLGIGQERFVKLETKDILPEILSGARPQPRTAAEAMELEELLASIDVYKLQYKDTQKFGEIDYKLDVERTNTGFDRTLTLVIQDDQLKRVKVSGAQSMLNSDKSNLVWDSLSGIARGVTRVFKP